MANSFSLRPDLEFSDQRHQGESRLVVKDSATGRFFRFSAQQSVIVDTLRSGPISLDELADRAGERLGGRIPVASLEAFLRSLEEKWLLDTEVVRQELRDLGEKRPRRASIILYLRLLEFDAEAVLAWLEPKVRWSFTPLFHGVALVLIIIGMGIVATNADLLALDAVSLLTPGGAVLVALVVLTITTIHELAHGVTCRHYGGRPKRIGFMLIYFAPALYCDVSDTWMFPLKRHRLWVTVAGGYVQLAVWGVAALVWRITDTHTLINQAALGAILFGGVQTLFNFNPLIKLDGYYILSDYLEIPNLREKASRALRAWLAGAEDSLLASSQRTALLRFAGAATVFSVLLLAVVYAKIVQLAVGTYAFSGLVASGLFIGFTLNRAAAEPIAASRALFMRANQRKIRNYGILFLVLAVVLLFPWELRIPADFEVLPFEEGVIRAETAGLIEDVYVREGTAVQTGDLIARLSDFEKESELERIRGEIGRARAELQLLELGPRAEEVNRAAQQVNISETRLGNVRRNEQEQVRLVEELAASRAEFRLAVEALENAATLYEEGLEAGFEVSRARTALEVAEYRVRATEAALASLGESNDREEDLRRSELAEAESNYSLVSAGPRSEDVRRLQVELDALERLKALIEEELALTEILAPISGTVITENMDQLRNRAVSSGEELARIVNFERVKARLAVAEIDLADVHLGRRIVLKARPDPLRNFEGEVDFIAPVAQTIGDSRFVDVETILASEDGALRPGTTGVAKIYAGRRLVIQLISRRLMHWIRTEFWDLIP